MARDSLRSQLVILDVRLDFIQGLYIMKGGLFWRKDQCLGARSTSRSTRNSWRKSIRPPNRRRGRGPGSFAGRPACTSDGKIGGKGFLLSAAARFNDSGFERKTVSAKSRSTALEKKAEKPKLVLDSSVFISAVVFGGKPREILELAGQGLIEVAISNDILEEIKGVLEGKKFQFPTRIVYALIREIEDLADLVEPTGRIEAVLDDPEDNRVLECAVESGANGIVSGDSHLLALRTFGKIKIMNPDEFLGIILDK